MAGDSEARLRSSENEQINNQPFLIGVSGGTASGKVSIYIWTTNTWIFLPYLEKAIWF